MKFKSVEVDTLEETAIEKGWELCRTAFDRGIWNLLLVQEETKTIKKPSSNPPADG